MSFKSFLTKIAEKISDVLETINIVNKEKAVSILEYETGELEHIFSLLVMGSFIGMPSPPAHISLELMPLMENEMKTMFNKVGTAENALSDIVEILGEP